jgi:hypothetical protein
VTRLARAALALVLAPALAHADANVVVTLTPQGQQLWQDLGLTSSNDLIQRVNDKIDAYYQVTRIPQLMRAFADTTAFADRDLGVGYAMQPGQILVGVVTTGALDSDASFQSSNGGKITTGEIYNFAIMAGANLQRWGAPKWSVFANGFYEPLSFNALAGHMLSTGVHTQYRIVDGATHGGVRFIGLDATAGLEFARWNMGIAAPIKYSFTVNGVDTRSVNLTLTSTGTLDLQAHAFAIPVEITSGLRFGGVVTVYAGGGADVTIGESTLTAGLAGDMNVTSDGTNVGNVSITASGTQTPTPLTVHAIAGVQLDASYVQLYAQTVLTPSITAIAFGVRAAF